MKKISADWECLRTFAVFVDHGTYAGAARLLGLTHATVGRRIRMLEEQLGGALFTRRTDAVELSELGLSVLETARKMTDQSAALERRIAGADLKNEGPVRIAATEALGALFLAPRLPMLLDQWPGLRVELVTSHQTLSLARRAADLSIRLARPESGDLIARKLCAIPYYLCGTQRWVDLYARSLEEATYIAYDEDVPDIPELLWYRRHMPAQRVVLKSNSLVAQFSAACAGAGLALLPAYLDDPSLRRTSIEPVLRREAWLVYHRDMKNVPRLRIAMAWLERCFSSLA